MVCETFLIFHRIIKYGTKINFRKIILIACCHRKITIYNTFGVKYSISGMADLLYRIGFVFKKYCFYAVYYRFVKKQHTFK